MNNLRDIQALRHDTPGCGLHVHLNNAGASLPPKPVTEAIQNYIREEALNGGYETEAAYSKAIAGFYDAIGQLVNAPPSHIAWASSATDAYNKALSSIPFEPGDVLLTTDDDYVSNQIAFLFLQQKFKVKLLRAAKLPEGGVDPQSMKEMMQTYRPKLVAVTQVPANSGLVQDVESIGQLCREMDIWYLVDACQSAGQIALDVEKTGCDFLSATMRKWMRGPRGAGFLFVSGRALQAGLEPEFPDLAGAVWTGKDSYDYKPGASRYEYWEKPYALVLGARAAAEYALGLGLENIQSQVSHLAAYTRQQLTEKTGWTILDKGTQQCGIVTAHHPAQAPNQVKTALNNHRIHAGIAAFSNALIDFGEKGVDWALRISPHYYNTKEEIDTLVEVLGSLPEAGL